MSATIISLYTQGVHHYDIAEQLGITPSSVMRELNAAGL